MNKKKGATMPVKTPSNVKAKSKRTPDHAKLLEKRLSIEVADKLDDIFKTGKVKFVDLDEQAFRVLRDSPTEASLMVLNRFLEFTRDRNSMMSTLLCCMVELFTLKQAFSTAHSTSAISGKLEMNRTEASLEKRDESQFNSKHIQLNPKAAEFVPKSFQSNGQDYSRTYCPVSPGSPMKKKDHSRYERATNNIRPLSPETRPRQIRRKNHSEATNTSFNNRPEAVTSISFFHWADAYPYKNPEYNVYWNRSHYMPYR